MVHKILASLSSILFDAQDRGLVAQNVAHQRRARNKGSREARQKRLLEVGVDIPTPAEIRATIARLDGGRGRWFLLTAIFYRPASVRIARLALDGYRPGPQRASRPPVDRRIRDLLGAHPTRSHSVQPRTTRRALGQNGCGW